MKKLTNLILRKYAQMWQAVYDRAQGLPENGGQDTLDKAA